MGSITNVDMIYDERQQFTGVAFVTFANVDDIETALRTVDGKRIRKSFVKVYRSSEEQKHHYCDLSPNSEKHTVSPPVQNNFSATSGMAKRKKSKFSLTI